MTGCALYDFVPEAIGVLKQCLARRITTIKGKFNAPDGQLTPGVRSTPTLTYDDTYRELNR
jgi:hypothetical protein